MKTIKIPANVALALKLKTVDVKSDNMRIAKTILQQLGGANKLKAMLGVKNFIAEKNGLSFQFKGSKNANHILITLNGKDLYDVEFKKIRGMDFKTVGEFNDVYADQLKSVIEDFTKLRLSL